MILLCTCNNIIHTFAHILLTWPLTHNLSTWPLAYNLSTWPLAYNNK